MRSDYDAFLDELTPITIHVLGQDWRVPRSPRADKMARLQRSLSSAAKVQMKVQFGKADASILDQLDSEYADTVSVARVLAGDEVVDAWLAGGIRDSQLKAIVADLWAEQQPKASRLGEAVLPGNGPASSSSNGDSSKPTSPVSTT
jgi:hypothetical protein